MFKEEKTFKSTKIGKFLTGGLIKNLIGLIPFGIGGTLKEFLTKTDTIEGKMSREVLVYRLIKILIYVILLIFGIISFEQFTTID